MIVAIVSIRMLAHAHAIDGTAGVDADPGGYTDARRTDTGGHGPPCRPARDARAAHWGEGPSDPSLGAVAR